MKNPKLPNVRSSTSLVVSAWLCYFGWRNLAFSWLALAALVAMVFACFEPTMQLKLRLLLVGITSVNLLAHLIAAVAISNDSNLRTSAYDQAIELNVFLFTLVSMPICMVSWTTYAVLSLVKFFRD